MSKVSLHEYRLALSVADAPHNHTLKSCKRALDDLRGYRTQRAITAAAALQEYITKREIQLTKPIG